jgi:hypothetical protein
MIAALPISMTATFSGPHPAARPVTEFRDVSFRTTAGASGRLVPGGISFGPAGAGGGDAGAPADAVATYSPMPIRASSPMGMGTKVAIFGGVLAVVGVAVAVAFR